VFINEPRLSEFKQLVVSKGIQAEMSGGVLICNNVVAVRRVRYTATFDVEQFKVDSIQYKYKTICGSSFGQLCYSLM